MSYVKETLFFMIFARSIWNRQITKIWHRFLMRNTQPRSFELILKYNIIFAFSIAARLMESFITSL